MDGSNTATEGSTIDWVTVGVAIVAGLGSGVLAAWITAFTQRKIARNAAKREASKALWNYQRTLRDYALERESRLIRDGTVPFTETSPDDIEAARRAAYPYLAYLGKKHTDLVARNWLPEFALDTHPLLDVNEMFAWSKETQGATGAPVLVAEPLSGRDRWRVVRVDFRDESPNAPTAPLACTRCDPPSRTR